MIVKPTVMMVVRLFVSLNVRVQLPAVLPAVTVKVEPPEGGEIVATAVLELEAVKTPL